MSTYCTTLIVLNYMYSMFSLMFLSMASPVPTTVKHLTLQHYNLVSLLSQEARLSIIVPEGIVPLPQGRFVIKPITCIWTKAFQHHVQILCSLSQAVCLPAFLETFTLRTTLQY